MTIADQILDLQVKQKAQLIAIVGPTCTGKSDLALELAQKLKLPIINADSRLIFQEMNIGTAKPSNQELNTVKHYLVDIKKPNESYSAWDYREDFDKIYQNLDGDCKAIVVGGTGLYLRCALENLEMPAVDRDDELREKLNDLSLKELQSLLEDLDNQAHLQVDMANKIRVIRAIEIIKKTNKTLNENRSKTSTNRYEVIYFGLNFHKRENLYGLINKRVSRMIKQGLIEEVQTLLNKYGSTRILNSTIGYKEIIAYLEKQYSLNETQDLIQQRTRAYAKRQITWFKQNALITWFYND